MCACAIRVSCHFGTVFLTWAVLGNIGPPSFLFGPCFVRSVLPRPRANIPQYCPRVQLLRGYYYPMLISDTNKTLHLHTGHKRISSSCRIPLKRMLILCWSWWMVLTKPNKNKASTKLASYHKIYSGYPAKKKFVSGQSVSYHFTIAILNLSLFIFTFSSFHLKDIRSSYSILYSHIFFINCIYMLLFKRSSILYSMSAI